jgi:hypothetical protein
VVPAVSFLAVPCCAVNLRLADQRPESIAVSIMTSNNGVDGVPDSVPIVDGIHLAPVSHSGEDVNKTHPQTTTESSFKPACNIVTPVGMLGYGLHADQTFDALTEKVQNGAPTAIILDSGSTDGGPEKLALGCMSAPRESYIRDLKKLIKLSWQFGIPLIFSSAGGDGSDEHVREITNIVREICESNGNE